MNHSVQAYPLRLPPELMAWVKEQSSKEDRSINSFLTSVVRKAQEAAHAT